MSAIEAEIEAVARELCEADGGTSRGAAHAWKAYRSLARGAIRALAPLIIERCAEVAKRHAEDHARSLGAYGAADVDHGRGRQEGHINAGNAIAQGILDLNHSGDATGMVAAKKEAATVKPDLTVGEEAKTDAAFVDCFAAAMKAKLKDARAKGRWGWQLCKPQYLSEMLRHHVEKGDPRDVANFCMFLWALDAPIEKGAAIVAFDAASRDAHMEIVREKDATIDALRASLAAAEKGRDEALRLAVLGATESCRREVPCGVAFRLMAERKDANDRAKAAEARAERMRAAAASICKMAALYFERTTGHYDRGQAARSYRASADAILALPLSDGQEADRAALAEQDDDRA